MMQRVLLLCHPKLEAARPYAEKWARELNDLGTHAEILEAWDDAAITRAAPGSDLAITLGGDGTLLRAARWCAPVGVPVMGIRMGRVGFLSEMLPQDFDARAIAEEKFWIEERAMLESSFTRAGVVLGTYTALNDVVVGRGKLARVIRLATYVDGDLLTTFVADGAIIATATGSTAYVFSTGGPILAPEVKDLVLVPIAPYLSQIKSLVLPKGSRVRFRLQTDHGAILTIDGQIDVELQDGDEVTVQASAHSARFARLQSRTYFYGTLVERLRERAE
ncbi:MAG: NAD(+)/NADH kinase [Chloroflexi bacterium]|nr:NAD(+)/NADH kinase [Chloroflexota bacterium]